ncbi:hypothetical protein NFI96_018924 [Prochilodus magdalenae]|nr:hypothetical protein NFI96_018924 [Prochilodus magdalenae]
MVNKRCAVQPYRITRLPCTGFNTVPTLWCAGAYRSRADSTQSTELQSFKNFVKKSPAFDVVVDSLNVANITPKGPKSQTTEIVDSLRVPEFRFRPVSSEGQASALSSVGRLSWRDSEWQRVIFSDESRFSLGGDAQRIRVWRHRGQHRDEPFVVTRPEGLVSLHLHPYRTICRNCVRMFKLHGMDYHRTPLGTSTAPYRDVWCLLAVVSELRDQGLNILVLGRKHMLRPSWNWDRHDINQIKQKSLCFFTENISEDDPFLLYAALHSGNHCNFVSRDLMRDHKACLPDSATRRLFFKWQRGHQLVVRGYVPGKRVRFQRTSTYDTIVQSTDTTWHIPYDEDGGDRSTYEVPEKWLCLTKEQH